MTVKPKKQPKPGNKTDSPAIPEGLLKPVIESWKACKELAREQEIRLPENADFLNVLYKVWSCSDFVMHQIQQDPAMLRDLLDSGDLLTDYLPNEYTRKAQVLFARVRDEDELARKLRQLRQREMVRIAWRDLAGWADLEETLRDLSGLAEASIDIALEKLHKWMSKELGVPFSSESSIDEYPNVNSTVSTTKGEPQSLVVIAMGKLGAGELNFSSDIDLIFAYPKEGETRKRNGLSNEEYFTRLGRRLIYVLNENTGDGFVYRVDMRLRPYGESGPLAPSFDLLEEYYQSQGREWERYAMIKARVVAGDKKAGAELLEILQPFVYRRYLDYGAFESLREMKSLISRQVESKGLQNNIKLGPGGIREIEFIGQAFQLIRGGREAQFRARGIVQVLQLLSEYEVLPEYVIDDLLSAYRFLRLTENRLQEYADQQTHELPQDPIDRVRLAFSMGFADWKKFSLALTKHRKMVQEHFELLFAAPQSDQKQNDDELTQELLILWQGGLDEPRAIALLEQGGFHHAQDTLQLLKDLQETVDRSLGVQGRERMDRLMPLLLGAVGAVQEPDQCLIRVTAMLEAIAGRTAYISLLVENPVALSQLIKLFAASPWIANLITNYPMLLDELLDTRKLYQPLDLQALHEELRRILQLIDEQDLERQMEVLRYFKLSHVLHVAADDIAREMPLMKVSDYLTGIAEVLLIEILQLVYTHLTDRHGKPGGDEDGTGTGNAQENRNSQETGFVVIAYGKLGGIELGYGSDLDLVFLHDFSVESGMTAGPKAIANEMFFARLGQRIIHMLNTHTASGILYEVDMRLRPSGASGLLVSNLEAFADYQRTEAWTWEHQALVRARPVAGDLKPAARFNEIRHEILCQERDPDSLRKDICEMRERMRKELVSKDPEIFDLKQGVGGITDIEFLVQYGVLRWANEYPDLVKFTDNIRLLEGFSRHKLMKSKDAESLSDAYRNLRAKIHRLALQEEPAQVDASEFREERERVTTLWNHWLT